MPVISFPMQPVIEIIREALDAKKHRLTFAESQNGDKPGPSLWLVKDEGVYLMSNAEKPGERATVVYAKGHDPRAGDTWHADRDAMGGDDGVEGLPVEWLVSIIDLARAGHDTVDLTVSPTEIGLLG